MTAADTTTGGQPGAPVGGATSWRTRWRARGWRLALLVGTLFAVLALAVVWLRPSTSEDWLAPDNPHAGGTMALNRLLRAEGIEVTRTDSVSEAVARSQEGATVAVVFADLLAKADRERLAQAGGDVVVVDGTYENLEGLTRIRQGETPAGTDGDTSSDTSSDAGSLTAPGAGCTDPDALAAQSLADVASSLDLSGAPDAVGCFPLEQDRYAYATEPLPGGGTLRVLGDPSMITNSSLGKAGNAALALRATGHAEELVWLDARSSSVWDTPILPPQLPVLGIELVLVTALLAIVQGRRFGRVVTERLPVVVRSTETTIARGRLYRRSGDRARAAVALRAGTAMRLGRMLGLPPAAGRADLLDALSSSAAVDRAQVEALLYGPPPPDDKTLATLAVRLDHLESEVRSR